MNKKANIEVFETDDFDNFVLANWNRQVSNTKIGQLEKSIAKYGYIGSPIVVNEKMEIIDGQHRFMACKNIKMPIQYIVIKGLNVESAITLNAYQSQWKLTDYVNSYVRQGNKSYIKLQNLMNEFKTGLDTTMCAVTENNIARGNGNLVKSGKLEISDEDYEKARQTLDWIIKFNPYQIYFSSESRNTKGALIRLYNHHLIDEERMLEQFEKYGDEYIARSSMLDTVRSLNEIYNIGKKKKVYFVDTYRSLMNE